MPRKLLGWCLIALGMLGAYGVGVAHGQGSDTSDLGKPPLPAPRWSDDSAAEQELQALALRLNDLTDSADWRWGLDRELQEMRPVHAHLLQACLNLEAGYRDAWKKHPGTIANKAGFLYARSLTSRALDIMIEHDLINISDRGSWQIRPEVGEDGTEWLERPVFEHMDVVEQRVHDRFWIDEKDIQHGEWVDLGTLLSDFMEVRL